MVARPHGSPHSLELGEGVPDVRGEHNARGLDLEDNWTHSFRGRKAMKVHLEGAPWTSEQPSEVLREAIDILGRDVWREAAIEFYAERRAKEQRRLRTPKGIQPFLNGVIDRRFEENGWSGTSGRFRKKSTWVRVTFRHQMSIGSDFMDALRLHVKEGV